MKKEYNKPLILISDVGSTSNIALLSNVRANEGTWNDAGTDDVWAEFF